MRTNLPGMKPFDLNHLSNPMDDPIAFIDPSAKIGDGVKIWHFSVVLAGVAIGNNVSIGSVCEIGRGCVIGHGTQIGSGSFLPPNTIVGNRVFIGPKVVMTDDRYPVSNNPDYNAQPPVIQDDVSIGAGAVILPGVTIYKGARIEAGSVVTKDVPGNTLVCGNLVHKHIREGFA